MDTEAPQNSLLNVICDVATSGAVRLFGMNEVLLQPPSRARWSRRLN